MPNVYIAHRITGRVHKVTNGTAAILCGETGSYAGLPRYRRVNAPRENVAQIMRENRSAS